MGKTNISHIIKQILESKKSEIKARLFVVRDDGITLYDSLENETTSSVSALVSGVWQASEALMNLAYPGQNPFEFRLSFDTSSQGLYLFPFISADKKYFLCAIYKECLNPGLLKRNVGRIRDEIDKTLKENINLPDKKNSIGQREEFLFSEITDEEMDRLFSVGGI